VNQIVENHQTNLLKLPHAQRRTVVAERIKQARLNNGLSQRNVASVLGISQSSYSRIESGLLEPSAVQIATLSGLFTMSVLWLLGYPNFIALKMP
jgi:transcriptional regulator with XRE-family HTH domain